MFCETDACVSERFSEQTQGHQGFSGIPKQLVGWACGGRSLIWAFPDCSDWIVLSLSCSNSILGAQEFQP
jgi:hypothetical protein